LVLLICGLDCSAYLWQRDGFAEFSKKLRQTPSPAGPRASGAPGSKASLQLPAARPAVITEAGNMVVYVAGYPAIMGLQPLYFRDPELARRARLAAEPAQTKKTPTLAKASV
jgi:hypothetical protein